MPDYQSSGVKRSITMGTVVSAYLWPEVRVDQPSTNVRGSDDVFVFQYWPESLDDSYNPSYDDKTVPGGSHPLVQWTGGAGRDISFTAVFTSEIDPNSAISLFEVPDTSAARETTQLAASPRYSVNVRAAIAKLQSFMRPRYPGGLGSANVRATLPPPRLYLVMENTRLGGDRDEVLVVLKSASVSYQAWFPSGWPRAAEVSLSFSEVVQHRNRNNSVLADVRFVGSGPFSAGGARYFYRGNVDRIIGSA